MSEPLGKEEAGRAVFGLGLLSRVFRDPERAAENTKAQGPGEAMLADPGQGGGLACQLAPGSAKPSKVASLPGSSRASPWSLSRCETSCGLSPTPRHGVCLGKVWDYRDPIPGEEAEPRWHLGDCSLLF